ncbi:MAG: hypothetical protein QNK32_06050, partial [Porticoccus sp.]|nr:hypothetical protein [Porticoccus sp.]
PKAIDAEQNITPFRVATEGMIWGKNFEVSALPENVYQNKNLAFQVYFPKEWSFSEQTPLIQAENKLKNARIDITMMARSVSAPENFIKNNLKIPVIKKSEAFTQSRLKGHTGFVPGENGLPDQRLAVIYYGRRAYVFRGKIDSGADEAQANSDFLNIIKSFRPISKRSLIERKPKTIHYVKATKNTRFSRLAKHLKLGKYGTDELRIINNYYPAGEPKPGEWIKLIQ